jgi:hypothetical protein
MTMRQTTFRRRAGALALAAAAALPLAACEDALLSYTDPDIITDVSSASGAIALKNGVVLRFSQMTSGGGDDGTGLWMFMGLVTDEYRSGDTFEQRNTADQRAIVDNNSFLSGQFRTLNRVRVQGQEAIVALRKYAPTPASNIGLMWALSGYSENQMGEAYYCAVFSELDVNSGAATYGDAVPVDSAFRRAVYSADSAIREVGTATDTTSVKVLNLARIVKGRALLNLGRYAEAATAVAAVPSTFNYVITHSVNTTVNQVWSLNSSQKRYSMGDREGGNGLPYRSANDPRLPSTASGSSFDSNTPWVGQLVYTTNVTPVPAATGVEARLIEAEAALKAGDATTWLAKLNAARATKSGLAPLTDPGTTPANARVDLTFSERAFWMFSTGHRLGDMRRLVKQYSRDKESVFPTGAFGKGGNYGTDTALPIPFTETNNASYTGCTRTI